jgi:hypothetical protein
MAGWAGEVLSCDDGIQPVDIDGVAGAGVDRCDSESCAKEFGTTGGGTKWCKSFVFVRLKLDGGAGIGKLSAANVLFVSVPCRACAGLMIVCACDMAYAVPLSM